MLGRGHLHQNIFKYGFGSQQRVIVPISQYRVTDIVQEVRSLVIVLCSSDMLSTIEFYYQPSLDAYKVNNISPEWVLAPELVSAQTPITQMPP